MLVNMNTIKANTFIGAAILRKLSQVEVRRALMALTFDWAIVFLVVFATEHAGPFFYVALPMGLVLIATRQHAFMILMHEGAHYRIAVNGTLNDLLSNYIAAYPLMFRTETYRQNHLAHHRFLNTDHDPDWVRKQGKWDWTFPTRSGRLLVIFGRYLFGYGLLEMLKMWWHLSGLSAWRGRSTFDLGKQIAYYASLFSLIIYAGLVSKFLVYWILPQITILPVIMRLRSIAEHFGLGYSDTLKQSRNILCSPLERFVLAPHNVSYHLDHHLYPSVPFYNLPELHRELGRSPDYMQAAHTNHSYLVTSRSMLLDLLKQT